MSLIQLQMKSNRSVLSLNRKINRPHSNSPTLSSSYSEKAFWNKAYKNQPFPKELKRILVGRKFKFSDFSDEEQDNSGVVLEEDENQVLEKKKKLFPHVKIMSDRGQFLESRSRIKSESKINRPSSRCKSVESLKLPQVMEQKKEEDQLQKRERSKLSQFKDRNQFNQHCSRISDNNSLTDRSRDSLEPNHFNSTMPERIIENEAEQTKSEKHKADKSMISCELEKLIVDEIDDKKWKKQDSQQQIQEIIEEEKQEQEIQNINNLRISLGKYQQQNQYLTKFQSEEFRIPSNQSSESEAERPTRQRKKDKKLHQKTINE